MNKVFKTLLAILFSLAAHSVFAQGKYSGISNAQLLYGKNIKTPDQHLATITLEHVGSISSFEHFGFADFSYLPNDDDYIIYSEWYPKLSLNKAMNADIKLGPLSEILIGGGYNAVVNDLSNFFVLLGGPVWKFEVPGFNLFQLETYFYQHLKHPSSYQITYAWDVSIPASNKLQIRTRGFIDYINAYGEFDSQIITQPQLLVDLGRFWNKPDKLFIGTEWRYWYNLQGISGQKESIPQLEIFFQF